MVIRRIRKWIIIDLIIYKNSDGNIIVDAIYKDETLWLTQKGMAKVFDCTTDNISLYLKIFLKTMSYMKIQLSKIPR